MTSKEVVRVSFFFTLILCAKGIPKVIDLHEDNWHMMLEGEWMVEFFAPWCPACKALQPVWKEFATWSDDLGISVGQVDVTESPGLSGRFMVTALPTVFHVKDGSFRQYRGSRDKEEFMSFIEEKKWEALEPVSAWKSPASMQMSLISQFFKLSMTLRVVHTTMVEDYGFPTWFSYLTFAVTTIIIGALLGLMLVCTIDFLFPPAAITPKPMQQVPPIISDKDKSKNSDDEEDDDDDDDDGEEDEDKSGSEEKENAKEIKTDESAENSQTENSEPEANNSPSSSPNVRKRKARKAD